MSENDDIFAALNIQVDAIESAPPEVIQPKPYHPSLPGRQSKDSFSLQQLAREHTEDAFQTVLNIMRYAEEDSTRLEAAKQVLDRGWGKPTVHQKSETVTFDFTALEAAIVEKQDELTQKMLEAQKAEYDNLRYLVDDVEVVENVPSRRETAI
jgi:hypothetical protein